VKRALRAGEAMRVAIGDTNADADAASPRYRRGRRQMQATLRERAAVSSIAAGARALAPRAVC
jgi:hypothetical protein